jgi:hypothetical protein
VSEVWPDRHPARPPRFRPTIAEHQRHEDGLAAQADPPADRPVTAPRGQVGDGVIGVRLAFMGFPGFPSP